MLRLKPIRRTRRPGLSHDTLRVADAAFWLALFCALLLTGERVTRGFPRLMALFAAPDVISAQAAVPEPVVPERVVRVALSWPWESKPSHPAASPAATTHPSSAPLKGQPAIAIVIDDLGADATSTRQAIALPPVIGLAFLPYPEMTPVLAREAGRAGHEVIVHVPMEAVGPADPGPNALRTDQSPEEIVRRLDWGLARVPGFIGINNHEGSKFTASRSALAPVVEDIAARHVFFFDSRTTAESQVVEVSRAHGVPSAGRDVFLDDVQTVDGIVGQIKELQDRARRQGVAIAIGHPHDITLDAVAYWAAHQHVFKLVTLSTAIRLKTSQAASLPFAGG